MRALVIDDEQLVLEGLEALLQALLPELSLDKTADVSMAIKLAATVRYEVILLDWHLLDNSGLAVDGSVIVQAIHASGSAIPIIVVSGDDRLDWPQLVLKLGLSGLVPKYASGATLVDAIEIAIRGGVYLTNQIRRPGVPPVNRQKTAPVGPVARNVAMTLRHRETLI